MSLEEQGCLSSLSGRRAWVVGCCGLLGSGLLQAARAAGMQVLGLDARAGATVQGDATQPAVLDAARAQLEPELIFCCAATRGGDEAAYRSVYLELPRVLHAACPSAVLVFCSSSSVYGRQGGEVVTETSPCTPLSARGEVLLEAERVALSMGAVVARLVPLYAAGRCELLRRFLAGEPELPGADTRWLNYVHQADAARALLCLAASPQRAHVVNVCGESFTKATVYEALSRHFSRPRVAAVAAAGRRGLSDQRVSAERLRSRGWAPEVAFIDWATKS